MTLQEKNQAYNRIVGSLDHKELKNAFDALQSLIAGSGEYSFQDKLNELQETYKYMLRYRNEGIKDPMQEQIYRNLQIATYELTDQIRHKIFAIDSPISFYSKRRSLQATADIPYSSLHKQLISTHEIENFVEYEKLQLFLFNKIWTSNPLSLEDSIAIKSIVNEPTLSFSTNCLIISALTLSLQMYFDKEKLFLLFDAAHQTSNEVKVRAVIGILLTLYIYRKRTSLYPQITDRLGVLSEDLDLTNIIRTIILRFILSRETEKISRTLQEEIIPEMMRLNPKISNKINLSDFNPEQMGDEMNPEWQEMLGESSLGKKMEEFSELQQEGADLLHSTFIHLKNFPFFRETGNWFLPFTPSHSSLGDHSKHNHTEKEILESMSSAIFMCNSDKYSLYFSIMQLPLEARSMMMEQFNSQASEMRKQGMAELITQHSNIATITGQYIQDLYRFYKLSPHHLDFEDIFLLPLDFHNLPILQPYISDEKGLVEIAEYYLRKNYFIDALNIYNQLKENNKQSELLFQKIGYCKQMTNDLEGALEAYLHADLLNPNSKWIIRKIATCYRTLKQPEKALEYYYRIAELAPDSLSIQINIGHCHLELKNYSEALKYYFKVDYLDSKSNKAWRPIAWCSFLTGKYDQARNYYSKILKNNPTTQDLLNAGHTEWVLQNIKGAVAFYRKAVHLENDNSHSFRELFMQDIPELIIAGIEEEEVPLMLDQLRYSLEE